MAYYKIKFKPKRTLKTIARYGKKTFRKGKIYTVRRKLTPTEFKTTQKFAKRFGYKILSIKKYPKRKRR